MTHNVEQVTRAGHAGSPEQPSAQRFGLPGSGVFSRQPFIAGGPALIHRDIKPANILAEANHRCPEVNAAAPDGPEPAVMSLSHILPVVILRVLGDYCGS
ncbi:hypothetical protein ACWGQL_10000 [Streptomyces lydicus]